MSRDNNPTPMDLEDDEPMPAHGLYRPLETGTWALTNLFLAAKAVAPIGANVYVREYGRRVRECMLHGVIGLQTDTTMGLHYLITTCGSGSDRRADQRIVSAALVFGTPADAFAMTERDFERHQSVDFRQLISAVGQ